jgi:hypothetical protein
MDVYVYNYGVGNAQFHDSFEKRLQFSCAEVTSQDGVGAWEFGFPTIRIPPCLWLGAARGLETWSLGSFSGVGTGVTALSALGVSD